MFEIFTPDSLSHEDIKIVLQLIEMGGQVDLNGLKNRVLNSSSIGIYRSDDHEIIGVGAIKKPNTSYLKSLRKSVNGNFDVENLLELGYIVVRPNHRGQGIANSIMKSLINSVANSQTLISTTKNGTIKKYLTDLSFIEIGNYKNKSQQVIFVYLRYGKD